MKTRVVILLGAPSAFVNAYYPTREAALSVVTAWKDRQQERINNGQFNDVEIALFTVPDEDDPTMTSVAIMAKYIMGMYIPTEDRDQATAYDRLAQAQERIAAVVEKGSKEGDEWKGD